MWINESKQWNINNRIFIYFYCDQSLSFWAFGVGALYAIIYLLWMTIADTFLQYIFLVDASLLVALFNMDLLNVMHFSTFVIRLRSSAITTFLWVYAYAVMT